MFTVNFKDFPQKWGRSRTPTHPGDAHDNLSLRGERLSGPAGRINYIPSRTTTFSHCGKRTTFSLLQTTVARQNHLCHWTEAVFHIPCDNFSVIVFSPIRVHFPAYFVAIPPGGSTGIRRPPIRHPD
jgi:hypothetical protein